MSDAALPITPELAEVVQDIPTMQRWEILRRAQEAYTVARLAAESMASVGTAQESLDRLVGVGLAVQQRAAGRTHQVTYRAAMKRLVIHWDDEKSGDRECERKIIERARKYSREVLEACETFRGAPTKPRVWTSGATTALLLQADAVAVHKALQSAYTMLAEAEQRARAEASTEAKPYHIAFELHEAPKPELPMAEVFITERKRLQSQYASVMRAASVVLSPRELEVARALTEGKMRPQISAELGLSENTVATMSKRIYRKLGVHNRSELSARLRMM